MSDFTPLSIQMNIDEAPWRDLDGCPTGQVLRICGIPRGTAHGNAAVGVAIELEDGTWVVGQTTLRLLHSAVRALGVRYEGDLR